MVRQINTASRVGDALDSKNLLLIADAALQRGFAAGAAISVEAPDEQFLGFQRQFIAAGRHADLLYLARHERENLHCIFPQAQTLLIFMYPYRFRVVEAKLRAAPLKIARYAWQRDYHEALREKLMGIAEIFDLTARAVTDSAPLPERYWARKAGLGRIGRNGMLISPQLGSYFMIASLLVAEPLQATGTQPFFPVQEQADGRSALAHLEAEVATTCGDCRLCVDACPTQALAGDGLMEIQKCISYRTIESKSPAADFPRAEKKHRWVFGCDVCQQVCPYNKPAASFAADEFNDEHAAAEQIANGQLPATRSALKGSVFFRRGLKNLAQNISVVNDGSF